MVLKAVVIVVKRNFFLLVILGSIFLLSGCTQQNAATYYGTASLIFVISEEEDSTQLNSKNVQLPLNYSTETMNMTGPQLVIVFNFPNNWSDIDYWLNITIKFNDLVDHYITIEIESIGWVNDAQKYTTEDKFIGHDAYRNGFPEEAIIKAWRLGTGPGCEYDWPDTGC